MFGLPFRALLDRGGGCIAAGDRAGGVSGRQGNISWSIYMRWWLGMRDLLVEKADDG